MDQNQNSFELDYEGSKIRVQRHLIEKQTIYRVSFSDRRAPLVLTHASGTDIGRHWTSIPEGRLKEAQEIGSLIEEFYKQ